MAEKSFKGALPKEYCLVCFKEVNFILSDDKELSSELFYVYVLRATSRDKTFAKAFNFVT